MGSSMSRALDIQERLELELQPGLGEDAPVTLPKLSLAVLTIVRQARARTSRNKTVLFVSSAVQNVLGRGGDGAFQFDDAVRACFAESKDVQDYVSDLLVRIEAKTRLKTLAAVRQQAHVDLSEGADAVTFLTFALTVVTYVRGVAACEGDPAAAVELATSGAAALLRKAPALGAAAFADHSALCDYVGEVARRLAASR
jgi:hypothetical protein